MSQEAPVPVIKLNSYYEKPGMAANVLDNLVKFNIAVDFITNTEIIKKTRLIEEKSLQQLLRIDLDPCIPLWNEVIKSSLSDYDAIVISDYGKGFLDYTTIETLIRKFTGWIFIDTKKSDLARFKSDKVIIKINELEYKNSSSKPKHLIVTRGSKGTLYFRDRQQVGSSFSVKKQEVLDVCGAGDTFLAAFVAKFLATKSFDDAIIFANRASSITVKHLGNYSPSLMEIESAGY